MAILKYSFGSYFKTWVEILYTEPTMVIKNNGWLSKRVVMKRGIRQGCPLSALLFILACEMLSIRLKKCETISGIKIGSYKSVICQYADDTTLTLGDKTSMKNAIQLINKFTQVSGLSLTIQKSIGIWLGPLNNGPNLCEGISFTQDPVKCLRIYIGAKSSACLSKSWGESYTNLMMSLVHGTPES